MISPAGIPSNPEDVDISAFSEATSPKIPQSFHIETIASSHNDLTKPSAKVETNADGGIDYICCKLSAQQQFYSMERAIVEQADIKGSSGKAPCRVPDHLGVNATYTRGSRTPPVLLVTLSIAKNRRALWSYQLDHDLADFCKNANLRCGVLQLLSMVPASETPAWKSLPEFRRDKYSTNYPHIGPKPAAWHAENDALHRKQDIKEALLSEGWNVFEAGPWAARFLSANGDASDGLEDPNTGLKTEILRHLLLHRLFEKEEFCLEICSVINRWEHWTKTGWKKEADYEMLAEGQNDVYLAWNILWMFIIASL